MRLNDILLNEKRKGGDLNPRQSAYEQLSKYKDDPSIYISFTKIDKIGINPQSQYNTPLGVYTYPLSIMWKEFDHDKGKIVVPFAGHQPHIFVLKAIKELQNVQDYTNDDMVRDVKKASSIVGHDLNHMYDDVDTAINQQVSNAKDTVHGGSPFAIMWNTTRRLSMLYEKKDMVKWNMLLRELGYNGIHDPGTGTIHRAEPTQAVFLTTSSFKSVDKINNNSDTRLGYKKVNQLINYVSKLIINDRPVPRNIMDIVLRDARVFNPIARVYSVRHAAPVPEEIVERILAGDHSDDNIIELFLNYQSRKTIPYPPSMVKFLSINVDFLSRIIKKMMVHGMTLPDEIVDAIMGTQHAISTVAWEYANDGKFPPKRIHDKMMSKPESNDTSIYIDRLKRNGLDANEYRESRY